MFTANAQALIESAKDIAHSCGSGELDASACLMAASRSVEAGLLLTELRARPIR